MDAYYGKWSIQRPMILAPGSTSSTFGEYRVEQHNRGRPLFQSISSPSQYKRWHTVPVTQ